MLYALTFERLLDGFKYESKTEKANTTLLCFLILKLFYSEAQRRRIDTEEVSLQDFVSTQTSQMNEPGNEVEVSTYD